MTTRTILVGLLLASPAFAQSVIVGSGSQEQIGADAKVTTPGNIDVQSGGSLILAGTSTTARGTLTSGVTAGVLVNALSGSTLDFKFGRLESILRVIVSAGAKINRIHDTVFTDLGGLNPGATAWIDLSALIAGDRAKLPFSFNRVSFLDPQTTPTRVAIKSGAMTPVLRVLGHSTGAGDRWGVETDPSGVIHWNSGQVSRTSPAGAFDTIEEALRDPATTVNSVITSNLGATAFVDDFIDFNWVSGADPTHPIVRNASLAPMVGKAVIDSDADTARRGVLVNCTIARGTVEETTAKNCTFFDPDTAVITVNNVDCTNCLLETGYSGTGNLFVTSLTTVTPGFFSNPSGYNFHLVTPGGDAAIDQGTVLGGGTDPITFVDADGDSRGADGKAGGLTGNWDIGADELIVLTTPIIMTPNNKKTNDNTPTITGTSTPSVTVSVYINAALYGTTTSNGTGAWTYHNAAAPPKVDGTYIVTATSTNGVVTSFQSTPINLLVDTVCNPPTNVTATPKNGVVDLEWTPSPDADVIGYRIYRQSGANYVLISPSTQVVTGTKYRDSGLTNGTSYSYKITAVDDAVNEKH